MNNSFSTILVVDDEKHVQRLLKEVLKKDGHVVETAENGRQALEIMENISCDMVLMDIWMPVMDGMEAIAVISEKYPEVPVIMMTAFTSVDTAVEAMKLGAYNYISKPFNNSEVRLNVKRALEIKKLTDEVKKLRFEVRNPFSVNALIGNSVKMQTVYKTIGRVAPTDTTVLIQGESGTGKELVAKAIHYNSPRKERPLVSINCAGLHENLLENELFGHERGAFTGAVEKKEGKFEYANRGTLFFDEIGEMPPGFQAKLLRVIQERSFQRVGGLDTIHTDVRIIVATNRNLEQMVQDGVFREDLYYRLNVVNLSIPPLRERKEDIPLLVDYFLARFGQESGKQLKLISPEAMELLETYDWSGNVRELENAVERAVVMGSSELIMIEDLPAGIRSGQPSVDTVEVDNRPLKEILKGVEKKVIARILNKNGWNKVKTSRELELSRKALLYKIAEYELTPDSD